MNDVKFSNRLVKTIGKERLAEVRDVIDQIRDLIKTDYETSITRMQSDDNFISSAWAEQQARYIGEQKALKNLIELLLVKDK